ncbi:MAG: sialate O-acetylesterase, partial [Akkermansiaceae bacterium]
PARFETMITQLRKELGAENVPVLIGEIIPGHGNHDAVNVALAETAKKTSNAALVSSADLGKKQLHYDSADYRALGKRYAEVFLKMGK